ncbi:serine/threonine protein kinase [Pendulispora brunnea]|uniref:Serine/threonine protein kinase n=1 Tax=Pendulispora brunnea TaxID=2905690 RepID=A0ABZ2KPT3_9BACT
MPTPPSRSASSHRALARIGTIVQKCRIERVIGMGGMAVVYAATRDDGVRVAIKFLLEHARDNPDMVRLLRREANVANQVGHPGAVPVLDCNVDEEGCVFLIMPLLEGESVRARWERAAFRMPLMEVGALVSDVLDVLASAHVREIVHCDIKPENLFIASEGDTRVLDFGIARRTDRDGSATATGQMIGTPAFMSPEQVLGTRDKLGPASDCWAVGATIFSLLSGELVHGAEGPSAQIAAVATQRARSIGDVLPSLPPSVVRFIDKALAFEAKDRWPSAREMREAWHAAVEGAFGEPVDDLTMRVRAQFAAELSQEVEATRVNRAPSTEKPKSTIPTSRSSWHRFVHPDIEARARIPQLFGGMTDSANRVLAELGLGQFTEAGWFIPDTRLWWPMDRHVAATHALIEAVGPIKGMDIGKRAEKFVDLPPDPMMHNIYATLEAIDVAYHLNHRRNGEPLFDIESGRMVEGIGHYHYRGKGDTDLSIVMECENPYPCEMDHGIILGFARRFQPLAVVEHVPGRCRKDGADSCVYHVSWW